ncbi:MAG: CAAD domain-containing protein [Cyanobacteriota bacterium]|jgi:hypothetical protein|nr:CAAD domain-containing protein [Cyanobacteriota bacterium]
MTDLSNEAKETDQVSGDNGVDFSQRYGEIVAKINQFLDQVDWHQVGRLGKAVGVILAVIVAQILIKGVLDTINLLPVVPGLLELLGLVIVGKWSWDNLTTSDKRSALLGRVQDLRKEYLG